MNKTKKSSGPSDPTDQSSTANANNDGNRNLSGREMEEVAQATSDGVPFIFVDSMPLTFCPPTVSDLAQKEAERMALVVAECNQLLELLEDTKPPPELDWPSTMIAQDEDFYKELQELCIFSDESEADDGKELCNTDFPGIIRQDTFYIDRARPILNLQGYGGGSLVCYTDTMSIVNQIGDQLMELQQLRGQPLVERAISCFLVSIKPEAGASNCFVQQIGLPASSMLPEIDSFVPEEPEKDTFVQPEKECFVQLEKEPIVQPEKECFVQLKQKSFVQLQPKSFGQPVKSVVQPEKEPIVQLKQKSFVQLQQKSIGQPVKSVVQPEKEPIEQSVKKSLVQPEEKAVVQPVTKPKPVSLKIVIPRAEKASNSSTNAVQKSRFSSHAKMPVSKAVGPKPGPTINAASEKNTNTIVTPRISTPRWKQISQTRFGYLSKKY